MAISYSNPFGVGLKNWNIIGECFIFFKDCLTYRILLHLQNYVLLNPYT